jgi:hypothetical protein
MEAQCCLVAENPFNLFLSVPGPKGPKSEVGAVGRWKLRETIDAAMFPDPISCLHMIGMGILSESGSFGLLRREEPLLMLSNIEEPLRCFPVRASHDAILQFFCSIRKILCLSLLSILTIQCRKNSQKATGFVQFGPKSPSANGSAKLLILKELIDKW